MFDLVHASSEVKKLAYLNGIRKGKFQQGPGDSVVVENEKGRSIVITGEELNQIRQYKITWAEVRKGLGIYSP